MRNSFFLLFVLSLLSCSGKRHETDCSRMLRRLELNFDAGNLNAVKVIADSIKTACSGSGYELQKADSLATIAERLPVDFSLTEEEAMSKLTEKTGGFTSDERMDWEERNWLEYRMINGERRYFNRTISNLSLLKAFYFHRSSNDSLTAQEPQMIYRRANTDSIIKAATPFPVVPERLLIDYTLTVNPGAVPEGDTVRCWLPWPRENTPRQREVKLISASNAGYLISPDSGAHRTIYMEEVARKGLPVIFHVSFSYQSCGQYFNPAEMKILPYDENSGLYRKYTAEQLPQICFTDNVKRLADSIAGTEERPLEIVRKFCNWFNDNIPWTGALEYSIIPNIPEYVIRNRRGDCGMQTLLFMSMLRYRGIPVRWQSGWKVPPYGKNLHDWCEIYYEGTGWVPADISYGLQYSNDPQIRDFFMTGIDSYRLIINDGISGDLYPHKKFMRSEPYDFQRGEVEWKGGNLYFDKWDYEMKIRYIK